MNLAMLSLDRLWNDQRKKKQEHMDILMPPSVLQQLPSHIAKRREIKTGNANANANETSKTKKRKVDELPSANGQESKACRMIIEIPDEMPVEKKRKTSSEEARPRPSPAQLIGNGKAVDQYEQWLLGWSENMKQLRICFLIGPDGCGKSVLAATLATCKGYDLVHATSLMDSLQDADNWKWLVSVQQERLSISERPKLLLLDTAECITKEEAKPFLTALEMLVKPPAKKKQEYKQINRMNCFYPIVIVAPTFSQSDWYFKLLKLSERCSTAINVHRIWMYTPYPRDLISFGHRLLLEHGLVGVLLPRQLVQYSQSNLGKMVLQAQELARMRQSGKQSRLFHEMDEVTSMDNMLTLLLLNPTQLPDCYHFVQQAQKLPLLPFFAVENAPYYVPITDYGDYMDSFTDGDILGRQIAEMDEDQQAAFLYMTCWYLAGASSGRNLVMEKVSKKGPRQKYVWPKIALMPVGKKAETIADDLQLDYFGCSQNILDFGYAMKTQEIIQKKLGQSKTYKKKSAGKQFWTWM
jgi:hypothetical protein